MRALLPAAELALVACMASAQTATAPERLMIRPAQYLVAPDPFPVEVSPSAGDLERTRARNLAARTWGMAHVLPCRDVALADTNGWRPITFGGAPGPAVLPSTFTFDSTFRAYHGGRKWSADGMSFSIENGWWGVTYDSSSHLVTCRVRTRAGEYVVSESRTATGYRFHAIPYDPTWRPSTAINGEGKTEEQLRVLWTAFMTMVPPQCGYMTGDPIRDPSARAC